MLLREFAPEDAPALLRFLRDPAVNRFLDGDTRNLELADIEQFICAALVVAGDLWRMISTDSGCFAGMAALKHYDAEERRAELALGLCREQQGRGYATRAADQLLDYGFDKLGLDYIYARVHPDNEAALRFCSRYALDELPAPPPGVPRSDDEHELRWFSLPSADFYRRRRASEAGREKIEK